MKVVHLSTYSGGGAGMAAQRLHQGLLAQGVDSHFLTLHPGGQVPNHRVYEHKPTLQNRLQYLFGAREIREAEATKAALLPGYDWFSAPLSFLRPENEALIRQADIVNLHWVADFLNWPSFFNALSDKPVVWTLHDQNPFTGGCHYSDGCEQFKEWCRVCPQLDEDFQRDVESLFAVKMAALQGFDSLQIIALSNWMAGLCKQSELLGGFPIEKIENGLSTEIFQPNGPTLHQELGLAESEKILLFVADDLANRRKGFARLLDALRILGSQGEGLTCLAVGKPCEQPDLPPGIRYLPLGHIGDPARMAAAYRTADAFVIASLEDNLPNTILESLSCGTPVAGFRFAGIAEMVDEGRNGHLALTPTPQDLADQILKIQHHSWDRNAISQTAAARWNLPRQANAYRNLYERLLSRR